MSRDERMDGFVELPEISVGGERSFFVVQFRKAITSQALAHLESAHEARRKVSPRGLAMLSLVDPGVPLPTDDMKMACARSFRRLAGHNVCSATVIGGVGFWASAARSTLTALTLLARPACPAKTFGDVASAIAWMQLVAPEDVPDAQAVARLVEQWKSRTDLD
jgi:hypothetical protein